MGNELACDCVCKNSEQDSQTTPKLAFVPENIKVNTKLDEGDLLYSYNYGLTKINLIKTSNLEKFFNSNNFLKVVTKKEVI